MTVEARDLQLACVQAVRVRQGLRRLESLLIARQTPGGDLRNQNQEAERQPDEQHDGRDP
jgi:hypothetical protein